MQNEQIIERTETAIDGWEKKGAPVNQTVRPLMPDALPALHLSDTINPSSIFKARPTKSCEANVRQAHIELHGIRKGAYYS